MKDLIKALTILQSFLKNPDTKYPTACEHDVLYVCSIDFNKITANDIHTLSELGFFPGSDEDADIFIKYNDDGEYIGEIDLNTISEETWNSIKGDLTNCFRSYRFGSC